jgi:hypothetical protein
MLLKTALYTPPPPISTNSSPSRLFDPDTLIFDPNTHEDLYASNHDGNDRTDGYGHQIPSLTAGQDGHWPATGLSITIPTVSSSSFLPFASPPPIISSTHLSQGERQTNYSSSQLPDPDSMTAVGESHQPDPSNSMTAVEGSPPPILSSSHLSLGERQTNYSSSHRPDPSDSMTKVGGESTQPSSSSSSNYYPTTLTTDKLCPSSDRLGSTTKNSTTIDKLSTASERLSTNCLDSSFNNVIYPLSCDSNDKRSVRRVLKVNYISRFFISF